MMFVGGLKPHHETIREVFNCQMACLRLGFARSLEAGEGEKAMKLIFSRMS